MNSNCPIQALNARAPCGSPLTRPEYFKDFNHTHDTDDDIRT